MQETIIQTNKPLLALQYDPISNTLIGDNTFDVTLFPLNDEVITDDAVHIEHNEELVVSPNPVYASDRPITVTVELAEGVEPSEFGDYNFSLKLTNEFSPNSISNISLKVNDNIEPEPIFEYKIKYFIIRNGYRLNIYQYVDDELDLIPIEVDGTVDLEYQEKKSAYDPIISSSIKINLECSLERDFQDLYTEDEKTFKAEVIKDGNIVFLGFILPDGIWQDFVADKWKLTISASDGLASLKNISFSNDNGLNFYGRMTALNIFNICLKKTGFELPINVLCYIEYSNYENYNIFAYLFISTERYFQNDNGNNSQPMDCESVMKSILQCFNATIEMRNGEWFIYRQTDLTPLNLVNKAINGFPSANLALIFGEVLGSEINEVDFFHCNGNQKISISPTVQAHKVSYTYGGSKNILVNGGLIFQGTNLEAINGINMPGWYIPPPPDGNNKVAAGVRVGYNYGVRSAIYTNTGNESIFLSLEQSIDILAGDSMVLNIKYRNFGFNSTHLKFSFGVRDSNNNILWYRLSDNTWGTGVINEVANYHQVGQQLSGNGDAVFDLSLVAPTDGEVIIEIFRNRANQQFDGIFGIHGISLSASDSNIKSKDYTGLRKKKLSTAVKSDVTVFNGDSGSDLFVGTLYKWDSDTPTTTWNRYYYQYDGVNWVRHGYSEAKELLEINAEDNLRVARRPMELFEGDFKGFIPHLNFINIESRQFLEFDQLVDKKFFFSKYSYSFDKDVTKMVAKEYSDQYFFFEDQYKVDIIENFGNESKVVIKTV